MGKLVDRAGLLVLLSIVETLHVSEEELRIKYNPATCFSPFLGPRPTTVVLFKLTLTRAVRDFGLRHTKPIHQKVSYCNMYEITKQKS